MTETLNSGNISTRLERIAELARKHPERSFRSVHHSIDLEWLEEAARRGRKDGAAGVDGQTWAEYEAKLEDNLRVGLIRFRGQVGYVVPSLVSMLSRARADVTAAVPCAAWA